MATASSSSPIASFDAVQFPIVPTAASPFPTFTFTLSRLLVVMSDRLMVKKMKGFRAAIGDLCVVFSGRQLKTRNKTLLL